MLRGTGAVSPCVTVGPMMAHVHPSSDPSCFRGVTEDNEGARTRYVDWLGIWRVFCDGGPRFHVSTIGMRLEAIRDGCGGSTCVASNSSFHSPVVEDVAMRTHRLYSSDL
ncbi:hypothetical protein MRX96_031024 [Rhipicephalus microplus]